MIFIVKTFILTVVILNLLQVSWKEKKLEDYMYDFLILSQLTKPIRDLGDSGAQNIRYIIKNKDKILESKKNGAEETFSNLKKAGEKTQKELEKKAKKYSKKIKKRIEKKVDNLYKNKKGSFFYKKN